MKTQSAEERGKVVDEVALDQDLEGQQHSVTSEQRGHDPRQGGEPGAAHMWGAV